MDSGSKTERFWDRAASSYDKEEKKDEHIYQQIIERTNILVQPADIVLDFGCGTGLVSNEIAGSVKQIRGIDLSSKMIEVAKTKAQKQGLVNIEYVQETIFSEGLKPGSFDVILGFHILHLLDDPQAAIRRLYALLKPNGLLISVTPCMGENRLMSGFFSVLGGVGIIPKIKSFKRHDLERLLALGGFVKVESEKLDQTSNQYFTVAKK